MLRTLLTGVLWLAAATPGLAVQTGTPQSAVPTRSLTVFPGSAGGGALVRETRALTLGAGRHRVSLGQLPSSVDPSSLIILTPGVALAAHGGVVLSQPSGGGVQAATVDLELVAQRPVSELRFAYLTGGFTWAASYSVVIAGDERSADLTGLATLSNRSGAPLASAEVQLLAGQIYRTAAGRFAPAAAERMLARAEALDLGIPAGEAGEYHLYTLPEGVDLEPGADRAVALLTARALPTEKRYMVRQAVSYVSRGGEYQAVAAEVAYKIRRPPKHEAADLPMPAGVARVYRPDDGGRLQLIGEVGLGNTPKGEDVWLPIGRAFEVTAERTQTDYQVRPGGRYESAWRIVLKNRTDKPVSVEVVESIGGDWRVLSATHKYEKTSAGTLTFALDVPAKGEATLQYRVEVET